MTAFDDAVAAVGDLDDHAGRAAAELHGRLTKPAGSLGLLEITGARLAAIAGEVPPPVPAPAVVAVFAGDHGVVAEGVTPWPQEVTAQMVANFVAGGAAINVLARQIGARVMVVDVGVAAELASQPGLLGRKVRAGTGNIAVEPAMTRAEARGALDVGAQVAATAIDSGARCLVTGDMGIGNTTPSAALVAAFTGRRAAEVTGRGTGVDDAVLGHKIEVVARALGRAAPAVESGDAIAILTELGGLEIAALTGFVVAGAAARIPVVVDGVIALAATCVAARVAPRAIDFCFAGHRSTEPAAHIALDHLGLEPLLDLGMRLGEGTGACLALPLLEASARILREMATFDSAGVTEKT